MRHGLGFAALALLAAPQEAMFVTRSADPHELKSLTVRRHGRLRVEGTKLVDQNGQPARLRGVSLYSSQWAPIYYSNTTVKWLAEDWRVTVLRAAVGVQDGYVDDAEYEIEKLDVVVQAAITAGIYVIIDWQDKFPELHIKEASEFFARMAETYGKYANVIFEACGDPQDQEWKTLKPFMEKVVEAVRRYSDTIVIVGSPRWGQDVDLAAADPLKGPNMTNLVYSVHFNAVEKYGRWQRSKVEAAIRMGVSVFASVWSVGEPSANGTVDLLEAQRWMNFNRERSISDVNWVIYDKKEACSSLAAPNKDLGIARKIGMWVHDDLTPAGAWVRRSLRGDPMPKPPCEVCTAGGENCISTGCCREPGTKCYQKDEYFAACRKSCTPGRHAEESLQFQTSWMCKSLGGGCDQTCAAPGTDCRNAKCCQGKDMRCYEKDQFYASCKETCNPGLDFNDPPSFRSPWTCKDLSVDKAPKAEKPNAKAPEADAFAKFLAGFAKAPAGEQGGVKAPEAASGPAATDAIAKFLAGLGKDPNSVQTEEEDPKDKKGDGKDTKDKQLDSKTPQASQDAEDDAEEPEAPSEDGRPAPGDFAETPLMGMRGPSVATPEPFAVEEEEEDAPVT